MRLLMAAVTTILMSVGFSHSGMSNTLTLDDFTTMSQQELNAMYANALPGGVPDGESNGRAIFFAGSMIAEPAAMLAQFIWQGKVFDRENGVLLNKVFGFQLVKARVYYGTSYFDGKEAIIVDYHDTSLLFKPVRDEIRQVGHNMYLGRAYIHTLLGAMMAVNFVLDFSGAE